MKSFLLFIFLLLPLPLLSQTLRPITRFHTTDSPYTTYANNFLSGFLQSPSDQSLEGFLQIPFVGDPLLVYVGEKDSTQFMAYASGYQFASSTNFSSTTEPQNYSVNYTRYHIKAEVENQPAYSIQRFTYPDTLAEKGFLIDLDHANSGAINEDMDIVFIDKRTVRAYKRSYDAQGGALYYVAHFSHPFNKWNIRREVVRLENGQREHRCKAALVFDALKPGEQLTVTSAVSALSTDAAYAQLHLTGGNKHFSDQRKPRPKEDAPAPLLAQNTPSKQSSTDGRTPNNNKVKPSNNAAQSATSSQSAAASSVSATSQPIERIGKGSFSPLPWLEISTREAEMQAAFTALISQLRNNVPALKRATNAVEFIDALAALYVEPTVADDSVTIQSEGNASAHSLLQRYAQSIFTGNQLTTAQASWFVFQSLGLVPDARATQFNLVRPAFNVVTMQLPRTRRFILHAKNNTASHPLIQKASWQHQVLTEPYVLTREQFLRGGILELKMK